MEAPSLSLMSTNCSDTKPSPRSVLPVIGDDAIFVGNDDCTLYALEVTTRARPGVTGGEFVIRARRTTRSLSRGTVDSPMEQSEERYRSP